MHIVGTGGFWRGPAHPPDIATKSVELITDELVEEAQREGYGAFGETGTSAPMTDDERKVFTATARAHLRTGIPIFTHNPYPGPEPEAALRQLENKEGENKEGSMVRQHRTPSVRRSVSLVAIVIGLLLGLVRHDIVNAAGGQTLPGSGAYRLVENWPEVPPDDPRFGSMSGVAVHSCRQLRCPPPVPLAELQH